MAIINPVVNNDISSLGTSRLITWVLPTTGDSGAPFRLDRWSVSSFSVFGTVTALALQGANDADAPSNWNFLRDWGGTSLAAVNAAGIYTPRDLPIWVRPLLSTGSAVTIQMVLHRQDASLMG